MIRRITKEQNMQAEKITSTPGAAERRQRGAALILTVIVIMVLTTLGMAMVAFSTTEEKSASSYRDTLQTRSLAEGGVRIVQMMFSKPTDRVLVPVYNAGSAAGANWDYYGTTQAATETQLNAIGIFRKDRPGGITPSKYVGGTNIFFNGPFGQTWGSTFGGAYSPTAASDYYDVKLNCINPSTNAVVTNCWLNSKINTALLQGSTDWNLRSGQITDISFYAPPIVNGAQYGIATVRVTAAKYRDCYPTDTGCTNPELISRETIEAIIGDRTPRPSVLGNGDINFIVQAGTLCGNGCEQIHSNGNANVGNIAAGSGPVPVVSATGSVSGGPAGLTQNGANTIVSPKINPWDLTYMPTTPTDLAKYYLVSARPLIAAWSDGDPSTKGSAARPCGVGLLAYCQDYNLEYDTSGNPQPIRSVSGTPHMYKWSTTNNEWDETGCSLSGSTLSCVGGPSVGVSMADDIPISGTGDNADLPFNITRLPRATFIFTSSFDGATILVDGMFSKSGAGTAHMAIVSVGSQSYTSSTTWFPASGTNRLMWVSGRDIYVHANCCAPSNTCATNLANNAAQGIMAAHEQMSMGSQTGLAGILIGENQVNYDDVVDSDVALDVVKGDHAYVCGVPEWPWTMPTKPAIFSMKSSTN
jgi:hypothetical protein